MSVIAAIALFAGVVLAAWLLLRLFVLYLATIGALALTGRNLASYAVLIVGGLLFGAAGMGAALLVARLLTAVRGLP